MRRTDIGGVDTGKTYEGLTLKDRVANGLYKSRKV